MVNIGVKQIWSNRRLRQILLVVVMACVMIASILSFAFYKFSISSYEQSTLMRLAGVANSIALQIDGDEYERLINKYVTKDAINDLHQDSSYFRIQQILLRNHDANMLNSPIYTIMLSADKKHYEFGVTSDTTPYYRHNYISFHESLNLNFEIGGIISAYMDEFGHWLSAFSPIRNELGETVAVIMVDEKFDDFLSKTRKVLYGFLWITLVIFLFLIVIILMILARILNRQNIYIQEIQDSSSKIEILNAALTQANDKLSNLDLFRREMVSNVSHDLRTPITSILGYLDLLKSSESYKVDSVDHSYVEVAISETKRLSRLVNDLFELSKLESDLTVLHKEPLNLVDLIYDITPKYNETLHQKEALLTYDFEDNLGLIYGDIRYIDRLFQNIIDNAVRHVDVGGFINISVIEAEENFKIKICNSGDMIKQSDIENIFDRYFTNSNSNSNKMGTGLGLAISRRICMLHDSIIYAGSENGITSFWFTLPKYYVKN